MDAVKDARVTIVQKDNNLLLSEDPENRPTASVMINTGGLRLPSEKVMAIQFLVARSVEGVSQTAVTVVDEKLNLLSDESNTGGAAGVAGQMMKAYQAQERRLETKIETMLAKIVGTNKVVAKVSVNLETKTSTELDEKFRSRRARWGSSNADNG